jgi:hypothetical protein
MVLESPNRQAAWTERCNRPSTRITVLLLLLAVPILSTLARNSWYLSSSDPGHFLITASKMNVAHAPILPDRPLLQTVCVLAPPQPEAPISRNLEPPLLLPSISVTLSLQHRSPPLSLA